MCFIISKKIASCKNFKLVFSLKILWLRNNCSYCVITNKITASYFISDGARTEVIKSVVRRLELKATICVI